MVEKRGGQVVAAAVYLFLLLTLACLPAARADAWYTHGGAIDNRRWARTETLISTKTAGSLSVKWELNTTGDVSATPSIFAGVVYAPDYGGSVYAINQSTGAVIWQTSLVSYGFTKGTVSRTTPVVVGNTLVLGIYGPAWVILISRTDGKLIWKTLVDPHPAAVVTGSGTAVRGGYYTGVSSLEESLALGDNYKCCTFIGSMVKLELATGKILWQTYTLPPNGNRTDGYSGGAVWGASPPVDIFRGAIYYGTGNNYKVPAAVQACLDSWVKDISPSPCLAAGNHFNSILALNITNGDIIWSRRMSGFDVWNVACYYRPRGTNCPPNFGPDSDFGLNPAMVSIAPTESSFYVDALIAAQKNGMVHALKRDTGEVIWSTSAGPGGELGGIAWGVSVDNRRVYVGIENNNGRKFTLLPGNNVTTGGGWVALDIHTGTILWSTANPMVKKYSKSAWGMLTTVANGVVFGTSLDPEGHVYAMDASTGSILSDFKSGASVYGGVSIDKGCAFFGRGYISFRGLVSSTGGGPQKIFALCVGQTIPETKYTPKTVQVGGPQGWDLGVDTTKLPPIYVGDSLSFSWDGEGYHNVYKAADLAAYETCTFNDDDLLGEVSPLVLPPFTAPGTFYYACRVFGHCLRDMKVIINVLPAPTSPASTPLSPPPSPRMPLSPPPQVQTPPPSSPRPPPPENPPPQPETGPKTVAVGGPLGWKFGFSWPNQPVVTVGDTLEFAWTSAHDVFLFLDESAYDACDFTRATVLGEGVDTTLRYKVEYEMTYYFGCSVGPHCTVGRMKVAVPVVGL